MSSRSTAPLRTAIVRVTIGSFSVAALLGVAALLSGGEFGETEVRVLLTTLLVGTVSVAVLCYLATAGTSYQWVGVLGGAVVVVPLATALYLIWGDFENDVPEVVGKGFGIGTVAAATLAQACLLLAVAAHGRPVVRRSLAVTLALATILGLQVSALMLELVDEGSGAYFRILGVVAILDVLGTVVVAALGKFGRPERAPDDGELLVPADLAVRLEARARESGRRTEDLTREALERYLG
jgi:hypothetical protein